MIGTIFCAFLDRHGLREYYWIINHLNHPQSQIMKIYFKTFEMNKQMKSSFKTYYTFCRKTYPYFSSNCSLPTKNRLLLLAAIAEGVPLQKKMLKFVHSPSNEFFTY